MTLTRRAKFQVSSCCSTSSNDAEDDDSWSPSDDGCGEETIGDDASTTHTLKKKSKYEISSNASTKKECHKVWLQHLQQHGTSELPKKPWLKTPCMILNSKQQHLQVCGKTFSIQNIMMHGSNSSTKASVTDAIDSICRTPDCIATDHYRWMHWRERNSRKSCGRRVVCSTCHAKIPFPCVHKPPCEWGIMSKGNCTNCCHQKKVGKQQQVMEHETLPVGFECSRTGPTTLPDKNNELKTESRKVWIELTRKHGTTKLPKKRWMKTPCTKLNRTQKTAVVCGKQFRVPRIMMMGTHGPVRRLHKYTIDSICRTPGCIIPGHHSWMSTDEKVSRKFCAGIVMCQSCHLEMPLPCSHDPPCVWRVVSKDACSACSKTKS
ncbi:expressed unknown protein [Seminavis robusta]|uniref:Uncharacterized protein n=1 Tax=Seminavis robusta TaxID=568900 RepID=A0A9N8EWC5_9STRA|nr:expressed unknown protein [Seminavis robusta]|eukprot:Sro2014_g311001.1  (377) ;mRNA; f:7701-8831